MAPGAERLGRSACSVRNRVLCRFDEKSNQDNADLNDGEENQELLIVIFVISGILGMALLALGRLECLLSSLTKT